MKFWKTISLVLVLALLSVSTVSAKEEYTVCPSTEEKQSVSVKVYSTITQGQTKTYTSNVGTVVQRLEVDLNWGDSSDSLSVAIYTPSGTYVGKFYDSADGNTDGRIHLDIAPGQGYVQSGKWKFKIRGESVAGTENYNFNTYSH
ncbi:MAG: hypothetical protein PWQ63_1448 [Methanolobus sp.]|nr:hypothetical protein [Methanolobus sp.]